MTRSILNSVLAMMFVTSYGAVAQTNGVSTLQGFRIERDAAPGVYVTFEPPGAAITAHTLRWPATPPTSGQALTATGAGPYQLTWTNAGGVTLELVASPDGNIRRVDALNQGGIVGIPGQWSNDFQGSRANSSQTASGNYSLIGGGQNNTASGNYSLVLGGNTNTASGQNSLVGGGEQNSATGTGSAILGGYQNTNAGTNASIAGGQNNSVSAAGTRSFIGGGQNNTASASDGFIGGGQNNSLSGVWAVIGGGQQNTASDTAAVVGGGQQNTASGPYSAIIGGVGNVASGRLSFIGGGTSNTASGLGAAIGAGSTNTASGQWSVIGGGNGGTNGQNYGFLGGGQNNSLTTGTHSALIGGNGNSITGSYSFIGGGQSNTIGANYAAIPGGRNMTLASGADGSFGYNAGGNAMSVSTPGVAVFANADIWLANNDGTPREFRFFESNSTTGTFPGSVNYVSFRAPSATNANLNTTYTLPDRVGGSGQVLRLATGATTTAGTMEWADAVTYSVATVNVTADDQGITAAQMDRVTFLRLNSDGAPANRTVTLANGAVGGLRLIVRCLAAGADGVELANAGNLVLSGAATLNNNDTLTLIWDATSNVWVEMSRSDN